VKQSFEIQTSKNFYQSEVQTLVSEISELKKDFTQNLAEVKSSIAPHGMEEVIANSSLPDVEMYENPNLYMADPEEFEKQSK